MLSIYQRGPWCRRCSRAEPYTILVSAELVLLKCLAKAQKDVDLLHGRPVYAVKEGVLQRLKQYSASSLVLTEDQALVLLCTGANGKLISKTVTSGAACGKPCATRMQLSGSRGVLMAHLCLAQETNTVQRVSSVVRGACSHSSTKA